MTTELTRQASWLPWIKMVFGFLVKFLRALWPSAMDWPLTAGNVGFTCRRSMYPGSDCSACIRSMKPCYQRLDSGSALFSWSMDSFEVTSDARKCFSAPNGSLESPLLTVRSRKCPLSLIWSCSFWPRGTRKCPFLLRLDLWSQCWLWPQTGSFLSVGWMELFLFPSESRPSIVWSRLRLPLWW